MLDSASLLRLLFFLRFALTQTLPLQAVLLAQVSLTLIFVFERLTIALPAVAFLAAATGVKESASALTVTGGAGAGINSSKCGGGRRSLCCSSTGGV